jgi:3-hydroxyisobutyrate dehydrogenase-like beta-hydroxyacid dehydrogenase
MRISVIGIGAMGGPIAQNLIKAGQSVLVYNRTLERAEALRRAGATVATSIAQACQSDVVITMLANDAAVEAVVFESNEFLTALRPDRVHISMSTISAPMVRRLTTVHRSSGHGFISAPVFGRPDAAQAGALSIIAAGPKQTIEHLSEVFSAIAKNVFVIGETPFHANIVKLCGNFLLLSAVEGLAETLSLARKHGVAPDAMLNILTGTVFTAPFYRSYGSLMVEKKFTPAGFKLKLGLKDIELLREAAREVRLRMPGAALLAEQLRSAADHDLLEHDIAALASLSLSLRNRP